MTLTTNETSFLSVNYATGRSPASFIEYDQINNVLYAITKIKPN